MKSLDNIIMECNIDSHMPSKGGDSTGAQITDYHTRRKILQGVAGGSAALLAGCSSGGETDTSGGDGNGGTNGDGGGGGNGGTDGDENEIVYKGFMGPIEPGANAHMNAPWGPAGAITQHCCRWGVHLFDGVVGKLFGAQETFPIMAEDWGEEDGTVYVELDDDWQWHNGDPVTTESIGIAYDINWAINEHTGEPNVDAQFYEDYEIVDDQRVEFTLRDRYQDGVLKTFLVDATLDLDSHFAYHPDTWNEWRERAVNTEPGTDEFDQFLTDLSEFTPTEQAGEKYLGFGPFEFESLGESSLELTKFEDHPRADCINIDRIRYEFIEDQSVAQSAWLEGKLDNWEYPMESGLAQQAPDVEKYKRETRWQIHAFNVNGSGDRPRRPSNYRRVRHAIAKALDFSLIVQNMGPGFEEFPIPQSHLSVENVENGVHGDLSSWTDHGPQETDLAVELINATDDFAYEDGQVYDDVEGTQAHLDLMVSEGDWVPSFETMEDQLSEFGFDVTLEIVDSAVYDERRHSGDYDIYPDSTGTTKPSMERWRLGRMGPNSSYQERWDHPGEWEVPQPVGEPNLLADDDELATVDVYDKMEGILAMPEEEAFQVTTELGWAWNQYLPAFIPYLKVSSQGVRSPPWELSTTDSKWINDLPSHSFHQLVQHGILRHQDGPGGEACLPEFDDVTIGN